jgi:hypothetical protein
MEFCFAAIHCFLLFTWITFYLAWRRSGFWFDSGVSSLLFTFYFFLLADIPSCRGFSWSLFWDIIFVVAGRL